MEEIKNNESLVEVVDIQFRPGQKIYFFDPAGKTYHTGDHVIMDTARGPEYGTCTGGNHKISVKDVVAPLRPVLRLANKQDEEAVARNLETEERAYSLCMEKITEMELDMQLVSAECAFDGSKILFFFTADERVDFRELVKSLASAFHTRIELRQIGVRDKARMVGGLGICGRPFCCATFLDDFQPVSIKMAKTQSLSLNPTKISGTCGRLMCCLKYEQNAYEDAAKRMPKVESFVQTPDGPGNVKSIDLLRETVKVSLDSAPETLKKYHNCEVCVLRNGKGSRDGIEIPDRPARFVEEREEEERFEMPVISSAFVTEYDLEDAPIREKMGAAEGGEGGKSRRRHRGGRRRNKNAQGKAPEQVAEKTEKAEKSEKKPEKRTEKKPADKKPERKSEKKPEKKEPKAPKQQPQPKAEQPAEKAEGGEAAKRRRRPHHRGGRRRNKSGGEGSAPKAE